jgi:hypothetical protein
MHLSVLQASRLLIHPEPLDVLEGVIVTDASLRLQYAEAVAINNGVVANAIFDPDEERAVVDQDKATVHCSRERTSNCWSDPRSDNHG